MAEAASPTSKRLSSITRFGSTTTILFKETVAPKKDFSKHQFFQRVQIHGLTDWYNANSWAAKTFWILVVVFFASVLILTIRWSIQEYYVNPIKTTISFTANDTLKFPYVQICPTNFIDWELHGNSDKVHEIFDYTRKPTGNILDDLMMTKIHRHRPAQWNHNHTLKAMTSIVKSVSFEAKKILVGCEFNAERIPCANFTTRILDKKLGICYSIMPAGAQKVPKSGFRVLLDLHVDKAPGNLPAPLEGVYVRVSKYIDPADATSTLVSPGKYSKLAVGLKWVKLLNVRRSKTPQICVQDTEEQKNSPNYKILNTSYSEVSCREDCLQSIILQKCKCLPLSDPRFVQHQYHSSRPCKVNGLDHKCAEDDITADTKTALRSCFDKCHKPCQAWHFELRESSMRLASYGAIKSFKRSRLSQQERNDADYDDRNKNPEISRRSKILLDISFEQLEFESVEQSQAKTLVELVSDIGGQTGLWLGASMVTIIQVLAMLLAWIYTKIVGNSKQ